ncbi:armc9 [Symbiodinium necroappetens]|uniref:Armc9 protein n=1 Tax=Symbiodinium necroappetens TaxID=1628268 RepID=A0A812XSH6_9DINO|nr:armc9 [Symbiodinium necroappetens]
MSEVLPEAHGEAPAEAPLPWCAVLDHGAGLKEVTIIKAIEEYLAYHRMQEPLDAFQRDVERVGLLRTPNIALNAMREVEDVLCSLDAGDQEAFSSAWSRIMPTSYHEAANALQLRLQANFAIHRARLALQDGCEPDAAQMQEDLKPFLAFLNERGLDEMSGDETLMPLFALPFVQRPHVHPDVREVFSLEWFKELRKDVEAALRLRQPIPRIYEMLEHSSTESGKRSWQSVWAELLRLADSSLDAMVLLSQGSPAPPVLATARQQLELLREHIPRGLELQLKSHFERPGACPMSPARSVRSRAATARPQLAHRIDFGALKRFLCASPQELCFLHSFGEVALVQVLRAILQRLASESPLPQRRGFLVAITCFDVLGVRDQPAALPALLEEVSELTLGILAVLACEAVGRSYIVSSGASVRRMVELLKSKPLDSSIHIQVLAAMQRLSLRRSAQDRMIEMGMVEWAIGVLSSQEEGASRAPSEFSLEFGSAMLMNLALRSTGKRKCLEQDVLPMAMKLMEHWNPQIRTHINGTLYSLLSLPEFRQSARRERLELALRSIHRQASSLGDEIAVRQILGTNTGTTACLVPPTGRRVARYQHKPKEAASQPPKQEKQEEIEEENEEEQEQEQD